MAEVVYFLCAATSVGCAILLLGSYRRSRVRLLLWSGVCFLSFAITNALLFVDMSMLPDTDLSLPRNTATLAGLMILLYGLVWERS